MLFYNDIYQLGVFEKAMKFGIVVHMSRNPKLSQYIEDVASRYLMQAGFGSNSEVETKDNADNVYGGGALYVAIYDLDNRQTRSSWCLRVSDLVAGFASMIDTEILSTKQVAPGTNLKSSTLQIPGMSWGEIYCQFQTLLFEHCTELKRLQATVQARAGDAYTAENKLFFRIAMEMQRPSVNGRDDWVRCGPSGATDSVKNKRIVAIGEVDVELFAISICCEYYLVKPTSDD